MIRHTDIRSSEALKKHLKDGTLISELYQQIITPEPSVTVDQAVLTAARKHSQRQSRWQQALSWAAIVIIFSLVGILTYHTLEKQVDFSPPMTPAYAPSPIPGTPSRTTSSSTDSEKQALIAADSETEPAPANDKQEQYSAQMEQRLMMPAAPELQANKYHARAAFTSQPQNDIHKPDFAGKTPTEARTKVHTKVQTKVQTKLQTNEAAVSVVSDIQHPATQVIPAVIPAAHQLLAKIEHLIQAGDFVQAVELLQQLQKNYPQQPVNPVILKHLSPYQRQDKTLEKQP